jgi:hypothetical protein
MLDKLRDTRPRLFRSFCSGVFDVRDRVGGRRGYRHGSVAESSSSAALTPGYFIERALIALLPVQVWQQFAIFRPRQTFGNLRDALYPGLFAVTLLTRVGLGRAAVELG